MITKSDISRVTRRLQDIKSNRAAAVDLCGEALDVIQHLQSEIVVCESELDTKQKVIDLTNDNNGVADQELWAILKNERDAAIEMLVKLSRRNAIVADQAQVVERFLRTVGHGLRTA